MKNLNCTETKNFSNYYVKFFLFITLIFISQIIFSPVMAAPIYTIENVNFYVEPGTLNLSVSGQASVISYTGKKDAQFILIDWGDLKQDKFIIWNNLLFDTEFSGKNFTTTWSNISHTYNMAGSKLIRIKINNGKFSQNGSDKGDFYQKIVSVFNN